MTTIRWDASDDATILLYEVESAPEAVGPWTLLASVNDAPRSSANAAYIAGPPAQYHYDDATPTVRWYRLRAQGTAGNYSPYSEPFQSGQGSSALSTTERDVVQMALGCIGETTTVSNLSSPVTKGEKLAVLFYPTVRDQLLGAHDWNWATRRLPLAPAPEQRLGWGFCYYLPSDIVKVVGLDLGYRGGRQASPLVPSVPSDPSVASPVAPGARWSVEANDAFDGRILCCDISPATLVYVGQATDPAAWAPAFLKAMVWALAAELVMPMAVKPELAGYAFKRAEATLASAVAAGANEANPDPLPDSEFVTVRGW